MVDAPTLPEHVTQPLLALITQRSLDADYEHVAARRAGAPTSERRELPRGTAAAVVLVIFGLLVTVAAVETSRNAPESHASRESLIAQVNLRREGLSELQQTLNHRQARVLGLRARVSDLATQQRADEARIERLRTRTGFGAVRGPGVEVTLNSVGQRPSPGQL